MATLSSLRSKVSAKLGMTIGATTVPSTSQVNGWLNEGVVDVARRIDPVLVHDLIVSETVAVSGNLLTFSSLSSQPLRVLSVAYDHDGASTFYLCNIVDRKTFDSLVYNTSTLKPDSTSPVATPTKSSVPNYGGMELYPSSSGGYAKITYVATPAEMGSDSAECPLPEWLETFVVDYAVMQAKLQDELFDDYMAMFRVYVGTIEQLNASVRRA